MRRMFSRLRAMLVLVLALLVLCSCVDPRMLGTVELEVRPDSLARILRSRTMEEAMQRVKAALHLSPLGYRWYVHDKYYLDGQEYPCLWLYAVNELDEPLDVFMIDMQTARAAGMYDEEHDYWRVVPGLGMHKNESASFLHRMGLDESTHNVDLGLTRISDNGRFAVIISGTDFAFSDLHAAADTSPYVLVNLKGEQIPNARPTASAAPEPDPDFPELRLYTPEKTLDAEWDAMVSRLRAGVALDGVGFSAEEEFSIRVDGQLCPCRRLFFRRTDGRWVDVVFTQDPDLLYRLYDQWEIFRWDRDGLYRMMNEKYGTQAQAKERYLLQTNFILQDCFYEEDGYGYVMTGCGLPMIDAGAACFVDDWCWYPYGFSTFVTRDKILTPHGKKAAYR